MRLPVSNMDHHATTPVDPRVVEAMLPTFSQHFRQSLLAQPHLRLGGQRGSSTPRGQSLAAGIGAHPEEIIFTCGATEANNLAIKGRAWALQDAREASRHAARPSIPPCSTPGASLARRLRGHGPPVWTARGGSSPSDVAAAIPAPTRSSCR